MGAAKGGELSLRQGYPIRRPLVRETPLKEGGRLPSFEKLLSSPMSYWREGIIHSKFMKIGGPSFVTEGRKGVDRGVRRATASENVTPKGKKRRAEPRKRTLRGMKG